MNAPRSRAVTPSGNAQGQQGNHGGADHRVITGFRRGNALQTALAKFLRVFGGPAAFVVAHELGHAAAYARHSAQNRGNGGGPGAGGDDGTHFLDCQTFVVNLVRVIQLAVTDDKIPQLLHHLGQSDQGNHGGKHIDAEF